MQSYSLDTLFIGKHKIELEKVDSTNNYALQLLEQNNPVEGTLITAKEQRKGKGQRNQFWESEPHKNITISYILRPLFLKIQDQFLLNKVVSLGILEFVKYAIKEQADTEKVSIKWPNDIYFDNKKLGGILIENIIGGKHIKASVIGIGVNVNQTRFSNKIPNPISLKLITKKDHNLEQCILTLSSFIEARYIQLKANQLDSLNAEYIQSLLGFQEEVSFKTQQNTFNGMIIGVNKEGQLSVKKNDTVVNYNFNEITF